MESSQITLVWTGSIKDIEITGGFWMCDCGDISHDNPHFECMTMRELQNYLNGHEINLLKPKDVKAAPNIFQ